MSKIRKIYENYKSELKRSKDFSTLNKIEKEAKRKLNIKPVNNGKKYLIISGMGMDKVGLFCVMAAFLKWVEYADQKGLLPVVDMQNLPNQYLEKTDLGKVNAWEYYYSPFFQSEDALKEALSHKHIVVNRLDKPFWMKKKDFDDLLSTYLRKDIYQKYFKLIPEVDEYVQAAKRKMFEPGDKICGVMCRGSDFVNLRPRGHKVQPDIVMLKEKIHQVYEKYGCNKVYVATEDENYLNELKKEFGAALVYLDCKRITTNSTELASEAFEKTAVNKRQIGLDYLTSISLLSMCDCIIAGQTSATPFIKILRQNDSDFDYYFEWELGVYE